VTMRYAHIVQLVAAPWAIREDVLAIILHAVESRVRGQRLTDEEIAAKVGEKSGRPEPQRVNGVAVLPLHGVVSQRMNLFSEISGGTSTEKFGQQFQEALADQETQAIVLDIDSPGGSVYGVEELAQAIYNARGDKPIVAVADSLAASAAYWIGSQADEFVVSPGGQVGSIGVFSAHEDWSKFYDTAGIKTTLIAAGKYKTVGNEYEPLSEDGRGVMQAAVDEYYDLFLRAVARGRGASLADVRKGYGEGAVLQARPAVQAGMVDRIETLSDVVRRLSSPQGRRAVKVRQAAQSATGTATGQEPVTATPQESSPRSALGELLRIQSEEFTN
jgi:capsid assembly protease